MASSPRGLSALQLRLLDAFRGVDGAWLTGGAALGGFHLHHRRSHDIDLFATSPDVLDELRRGLGSFCTDQGLDLEPIQTHPGFRRLRVTAGPESTLVDLVHEQAPQVVELEDKPLVDRLRIDPLRELRANKLAAILGRAETKDLVDLHAMDGAGWAPLGGLTDAARKDAGLDEATLGWVLSTLRIDLEGLLLNNPVSVDTLDAFRVELVEALKRGSFPAGVEESD